MQRESRLPPLTTPLLEAAERGDLAALERLLLTHHVNQTNRLGQTALHLAVRSGNHDAVRLLLARGADPNAHGPDEVPPLAEAPDANIAIALLDAGAALDPTPVGYRTPLTCACLRGNLDQVRLLVERGADVNRSDKCRTPLEASSSSNGVAVTEFLLSRGADAKRGCPLVFGAKHGDKALVMMLLDHGADLNRSTDDGRSPVFAAADCPKGDEVLALLLDHGADPRTANSLNDTPLHMACKHARLASVEKLLAAGASVKSVSQHGMTPLHWAAHGDEHVDRTNIPAILSRLLAAGAGPLDARDEWGQTPLFRAAQRNDPVAARVLLDAGADPTIPNQEGISARELARQLHWVDPV